MNDFKKSYTVPLEQLKDKNQEEFNKIYSELLDFLKTIDFNSIFASKKATLENYKSLSLQEKSNDTQLPDKTIAKIITLIKSLLKPEFKKYWDSKTLPNRTSEPNWENLSEPDKIKAKSQYKEKLNHEESDIRLMAYINELHKKILVYEDHSIRDYYINLCTAILLQYSKSHPKESTKIHFRFKSPKGLAIKLAKNIIVNGHFERDPQTGKDKFEYKDISDTFGAKIVSERGYYPHSSFDSEIKQMIEARDKKFSELLAGGYEIFSEKIDELTYDENTSIKITYREYFQKCLDILEKHKASFNSKEEKVIESIEQQIEYINEQIRDADNMSILDENITLENYNIFVNPKTSYKNFLTAYQKRISAPLSLAGLRRGLNTILYNPGVTDEQIIARTILLDFGIKLPTKPEKKSTSSGHEAIHYDIETPYGKFELQAQDSSQYEFDKRSPTAAHSLMDGKKVTLYPIPKTYEKSAITNPGEFLEIRTSTGSVLYYRKSEVQEFRDNVENLTAKKGKIIYNEGLENAQIELYSSYYDYFTLAMEIPKNYPYESKIQNYFSTLQEKPPFALKQKLFRYTDPKLKHTTLSEIRKFILPFKFGRQQSSNIISDTDTGISR